MQEQKSLNLTGGQVGAWYAPDITNDKGHGIGSWSQEDLVTYLKTGKLENRAQAAGSMAEAISYSFQHLTDADLNAIATYVRSVPSANARQASGITRFDKGSAGNDMAAFRGKNYADGLKGDHAGAQIFAANCASCHGYNAQGTKDGYYPSLFHNAATAGDNSINVISAILNGVDRHTEAGHVFMPPFGDQANAVVQLNNVEVASLSNYLLAQYGNDKLTVTPEEVQVLREGGPKSNIVQLARIGMGAGAVAALLLVVSFVWYRARRKARPAHAA
jgi:mono/diheme cytochrome c family protein